MVSTMCWHNCQPCMKPGFDSNHVLVYLDLFSLLLFPVKKKRPAEHTDVFRVQMSACVKKINGEPGAHTPRGHADKKTRV